MLEFTFINQSLLTGTSIKKVPKYLSLFDLRNVVITYACPPYTLFGSINRKGIKNESPGSILTLPIGKPMPCQPSGNLVSIKPSNLFFL